MNIKVYNVLGKEVKSQELNSVVFGQEWHKQSVFDTILSERAHERQGTHSVKNRSAVRGGGRKPWKQKGTGRARAGSKNSPIWRGGGVVFGPQKNRNYELKVNKKVRKLAYKAVYSKLLAEDKLISIDKIEFSKPSTKDFVKLLENLKLNKVRRVLFIVENYNEEMLRSASNLKNVMIVEWDAVKVEHLMLAHKLILVGEAINKIEGVYNV